MKELNFSEIPNVSGGYSNNGYDFRFIVDSAVSGFTWGLFFIFKTPYSPLIGAGAGASYGLLMMGANLADHYTFPSEPKDSISYPIVIETAQ